MFRRKKNQTADAAGEQSEQSDAVATATTDEVPRDQPVEAGSATDETAAPAPPPERPAPEPQRQQAAYMPEPDDDRLPVSFWIESVFTNAPPANPEERERMAAQEFQAAIAPGLEGLREVVPDASSPEEAKQILEEQQGEFVEDTEGPNLSASDIYRSDTSVYYRIRTHFDRPRRRVGWGGEWRPPAGLSRPVGGRRSRPELGRGDD